MKAAYLLALALVFAVPASFAKVHIDVDKEPQEPQHSDLKGRLHDRLYIRADHSTARHSIRKGTESDALALAEKKAAASNNTINTPTQQGE